MSIDEKQTLKQVKTQLAKIIGDTEAIKIQISTLQKELSAKLKTVKELQAKVTQLEHPVETSVSEHAILRYLERVGRLDMDDIRRKILTDKVKTLMETLGQSGTYPTGLYDADGKEYRVKVVDNVVVTVTV